MIVRLQVCLRALLIFAPLLVAGCAHSHSSGQLTNVTGFELGSSQPRLHQKLGYAFDPAGNLASRKNNNLTHTFGANDLNQLTTISRSGDFTLSGRSRMATNVTVNGSTADLYSDKTFAKAGLALADGNNTFTAIATDNYGRSGTNSITANLPAFLSYTYDLNGNLTGDGQRVFTYDDENQLIKVEVVGSWRVEYSYDGLGRRRIRKEFNGSGQLIKETRYIDDGFVVIHERDGSLRSSR